MESILTNLADRYPNVSRSTSANKISRKSENVGTLFVIEYFPLPRVIEEG